ncbi:MAG: DUF6468 domain-containing protein [Bdellovibrionales bacterium]
MPTEFIKIALDIVILVGLGGFMYYALRLSKALNTFRAGRAEFETLMKQLGRNIDDAQSAITNLRASSKNAGDDLQKLVRDAQFIADDLEIMIKSGNNLANRLEGVAGQSGGHKDNVGSLAKPKKPKAEKGFAIQDREFEGDDEEILDPAMENLGSEAEKELYKALQKAKN